MWRVAQPSDDEEIAAMCGALYAEDPGEPGAAAHLRATLEAFRREPTRGRAVVAERSGQVVGYALLVSFWSNEYGGEICVVDELFVAPRARGAGIGRSLFDAVVALWPSQLVALELEVTPGNARARALYEGLGFRAKNALLRRRVGEPR